MMIPSEMRELVLRLLTYEAFSDKASGPTKSATLRVYEKLRRSLETFAGATGFYALASRALTLARSDAPSLSAARIAPDGSLRGLRECMPPDPSLDSDRAGEDQDCDEEVILIAQLLRLLLVFLGEALTLSLLRDAWPGAAFDDCNLGSGRKS